MSASWLCLAAALVLLPPARPRPPGAPAGRPSGPERGRASGPERGRPSGPERGLVAGRRGPALAVLLVLGACVVTAGPVAGSVAAAVLGPAAALAVRAAGRRPAPVRLDRSVALPLDLAAAVLRSGRPLADALTLAAPAAARPSGDLLLRVAGLARLGAPAEDAWSLVPAGHPLRPLAQSAVRSAASGIRLADAFERHAAELRAEATATATARAQRAGISAMAPLAACFLPSFVCLGVVPIVIGMATNALGVLS